MLHLFLQWHSLISLIHISYSSVPLYLNIHTVQIIWQEAVKHWTRFTGLHIKHKLQKEKKPLATFKINKTLNKIQILLSIHFYCLQVTHVWLYKKRCTDTSNFKLRVLLVSFLFQLLYNEKNNCHNTHHDWICIISDICEHYLHYTQWIS